MAAVFRVLVILHRYLGIAVGLIMLLWCLSGFVMMYHGYPHLAEVDRLKGLEPLRFAGCCDTARLALADDARVRGFRIEMLGERPVLRARGGKGVQGFDLRTGAKLPDIDAPTALSVAVRYGQAHGVAGTPRLMDLKPFDQWTVEGAVRRGPVYRFRFDDPARTDLYVAQRTGEAAQVANGTDRLLGWLGAVPHWLYPTLLRQDGELWSQVVIWTSTLGGFLTVTGLYLGVVRFRRYRSGRWSPYRGWFYWHHYEGLFFGVLTLTWVVSGLLTMNPWGLLDSPVAGVESARLQGQVSGADLKRFVAALGHRAPGPQAVQVDGAPLDGKLFAVERSADGSSARLDAAAAPAPLARSELAGIIGRGRTLADLSLLTREDAFYYKGYERSAPLPVWRARLADAEATALYVDPASGRLLGAVDNTERASRWLRVGLHDWDFPGLRARPLWDVLVLILLAGVTGVCATGAWLAIKRAARDLSGLREPLRRLQGRLRGRLSRL